MISVISIGICDYLNEDYSRISCAKEDAVKVYTVLKHALGDKFSDFSSICLVNIKLNHLLAFLESAFSCLGKDDIVVL